jgi:hypothetical protein
MLSGVLHSQRAVEVNIAIMRTFVQLRSMLASNAELAAKLATGCYVHGFEDISRFSDHAPLIADLSRPE